MKLIAPILALAVLLAAYHTAGSLWGKQAKLYIAIGLLVVYGAISLTVYVLERRMRKEHPDIAAALDLDSGPPWYWKLLDGMLGVTFAFGPPVMVSVIGRQPLSWESEFTGYHLLAMAGGIGVYLPAKAYVVRKWQQKHVVSKDADKP